MNHPSRNLPSRRAPLPFQHAFGRLDAALVRATSRNRAKWDLVEAAKITQVRIALFGADAVLATKPLP